MSQAPKEALSLQTLGPVLMEARRASELHPEWPNDIFQALAIVGEEFGELQQACLKYTFSVNPTSAIYAIRSEAIQLAAMALQFLAEFEARCGPGGWQPKPEQSPDAQKTSDFARELEQFFVRLYINAYDRNPVVKPAGLPDVIAELRSLATSYNALIRQISSGEASLFTHSSRVAFLRLLADHLDNLPAVER